MPNTFSFSFLIVCQSEVKITVWKEIVVKKDSATGELSSIDKFKLICKVQDKLSKCGMHSTHHMSTRLSDPNHAGLGLPVNFSVAKKQLWFFVFFFLAEIQFITLCLHPVRKDSGCVPILMSTSSGFW